MSDGESTGDVTPAETNGCDDEVTDVVAAAAESKDDTDAKQDQDGAKTNEEKNEESEEEEEESDEDESLQPGLLERPVVLEEGVKRERKKVERMTPAAASPATKSLEIVDGKGTKFGDIPNIEFFINRTLAADLKLLHRLAFGKPGTNQEVKKNLRRFSGYPFDDESSEYNKRMQILKSQTMKGLKTLCLTLDVERGGTKDVLIERIMTFMLSPESSGRPQIKSKRRRSKSGQRKDKKSAAGKKGGKKKTGSPKKSAKSQKEVEESESEDEEEEEEEEEDSVSSSVSSEDEPEEEPPKKRKKVEKTPPKKQTKATPKKPAAKANAKKTEKKESAPATKKSSKPTKKVETSSSSDSSDSDDDLPLQKKPSKPPSDEELREVIKKILDGANLEEITMKTVCKQVYDKYPQHDLTVRKDYIKATVKQIIR